MKFIEKKCPNCGANLKFKLGDRDARCESCRREFIIENDADDIAGDLKDAAAKLKDQIGNINLVPATKLFGTVFAIHSIVIMVISAVVMIFIILGIINAVNSFNSIHERREAEQSEFRDQEERIRKQQEELEKQMRKAMPEDN